MKKIICFIFGHIFDGGRIVKECRHCGTVRVLR